MLQNGHALVALHSGTFILSRDNVANQRRDRLLPNVRSNGTPRRPTPSGPGDGLVRWICLVIEFTPVGDCVQRKSPPFLLWLGGLLQHYGPGDRRPEFRIVADIVSSQFLSLGAQLGDGASVSNDLGSLVSIINTNE